MKLECYVFGFAVLLLKVSTTSVTEEENLARVFGPVRDNVPVRGCRDVPTVYVYNGELINGTGGFHKNKLILFRDMHDEHGFQFELLNSSYEVLSDDTLEFYASNEEIVSILDKDSVFSQILKHQIDAVNSEIDQSNKDRNWGIKGLVSWFRKGPVEPSTTIESRSDQLELPEPSSSDDSSSEDEMISQLKVVPRAVRWQEITSSPPLLYMRGTESRVMLQANYNTLQSIVGEVAAQKTKLDPLLPFNDNGKISGLYLIELDMDTLEDMILAIENQFSVQYWPKGTVGKDIVGLTVCHTIDMEGVDGAEWVKRANFFVKLMALTYESAYLAAGEDKSRTLFLEPVLVKETSEQHQLMKQVLLQVHGRFSALLPALNVVYLPKIHNARSEPLPKGKNISNVSDLATYLALDYYLH